MTGSQSDQNLVIATAVEAFWRQKKLAERAIGQLPGAQLHQFHQPQEQSAPVILGIPAHVQTE